MMPQTHYDFRTGAVVRKVRPRVKRQKSVPTERKVEQARLWIQNEMDRIRSVLKEKTKNAN